MIILDSRFKKIQAKKEKTQKAILKTLGKGNWIKRRKLEEKLELLNWEEYWESEKIKQVVSKALLYCGTELCNPIVRKVLLKMVMNYKRNHLDVMSPSL